MFHGSWRPPPPPLLISVRWKQRLPTPFQLVAHSDWRNRTENKNRRHEEETNSSTHLFSMKFVAVVLLLPAKASTKKREWLKMASLRFFFLAASVGGCCQRQTSWEEEGGFPRTVCALRHRYLSNARETTASNTGAIQCRSSYSPLCNKLYSPVVLFFTFVLSFFLFIYFFFKKEDIRHKT
jgi:hypothetical protein